MKQHVFILLLMMSGSAVVAQNSTSNSNDYKTAVGIKVWNGGGANLKTFLSEKTALEFTGFFYNRGTRITGLYELHGELNTEGNLRWYLGGGAHVSLYKGYTGVGIDGVIGLDYKVPTAPLNIALDWQPAVELGSGSYNGFYGNWGGLAIRFTL